MSCACLQEVLIYVMNFVWELCPIFCIILCILCLPIFYYVYISTYVLSNEGGLVDMCASLLTFSYEQQYSQLEIKLYIAAFIS